MSTAAFPLPQAPSTTRIFLNEIRFEVLRALRTRAFSLSAIGFPVMFYCLFGLVMNRSQSHANVEVAKYLLGSYAIFGSLGAAIFGIGLGVALDRTAGWLELKQASPMPPAAYLLSKCCMAMVFSVIIVSVLTVLGITLGHVHIQAVEFGRMLLIAAGAAVPFSCLGLALAFTVPPNAASGIANMVYLPMSFLSGLWIPISMLPKLLQKLAPVFPSYHLSELMHHALGAESRGTLSGHLFGIAGFSLVMIGITWIALQRREQNA